MQPIQLTLFVMMDNGYERTSIIKTDPKDDTIQILEKLTSSYDQLMRTPEDFYTDSRGLDSRDLKELPEKRKFKVILNNS